MICIVAFKDFGTWVLVDAMSSVSVVDFVSALAFRIFVGFSLVFMFRVLLVLS